MTPTKGSRWLYKRENRIVIVESVSEVDMLVWYHYEGDETIWHTDLFNFVLWKQFERLI